MKNPSEIIDILSQYKVYRQEEGGRDEVYDLFSDDELIVADTSGEYSADRH